jgi:hypothetical protein
MTPRLSSVVFALCVALAGTASAQASGPGSAATARTSTDIYVPLYGVTAGIAIPVGRLSDDHAAGYTLGGLVEYGIPLQPYALRGELIYQHFSLKSGRSGTVGLDDSNLISLGATIVYKMQPTPANTFLTGGIAVYHETDAGTRPGVNGGAGIEIPLTGFSATGELRLHLMLADGKPIMTVPLTIGIRF